MPAEPQCVIRHLPGWTGALPGWTGSPPEWTVDDRGQPGLHQGSTGKVLKCIIPPGWTGSHRVGPATTGLAPGTTGTVPGTTGMKHLNIFPVESRLSPVKPGRCRSSAGVWCRYSPGECRRSDGIPGLCRDSAGFHRVQPFRLDVHAHSEARHLLHWEMAVCSNWKLHVICPEMDTETSLSNLYIIFVLRCATNTYSVRNLYIKRLVISFETKNLHN